MMMVVNIVVVIVNDVVLFNSGPKYNLGRGLSRLILTYVNLPSKVKTESFFRERKFPFIRSQT